MGFAYILKVFSFCGVRATILNLKSHYTRHVKLDFGVSVALCLFLYGFAYVFKGVLLFGVRATILNLKSYYTQHVKLDFGVFLLSACFCMGFAYILKVFSFCEVRATILNPKSHYARHVKLDCFCMVLIIFWRVFSLFGPTEQGTVSFTLSHALVFSHNLARLSAAQGCGINMDMLGHAPKFLKVRTWRR